MFRVLRRGGTAVIVDMRSDASPEEIEKELKGMHLGRLDEWMTRHHLQTDAGENCL